MTFMAIVMCAFVATVADAMLTPLTLWAAQRNERTRPSRPLTSSKAPKVNAAPASLAPVTVHNVRVFASAEKARLVLDLDRTTQPIEPHAENPSRVVIALPNTSMSQSARTKLDDGTVPSPFIVTQTEAPTVAVSLPTTEFRTYKQFTLSDPPRLVIDVTFPAEGEPPTPPDSPDAEESVPSPVQPLDQPVAPPSKGYTTIVIDPGHGGKDGGAMGKRRTEEKDITLKVGLTLRELLKKQPGVRVLMTRDRDVFIELEERAKFANSQNADLFVSIHVNSHPSRSVKGLEVYHFGEAKDQRALEVAARENGTPLNSTGVGWEYLVADLLTSKKIESSLELAWTAKEAMVSHMNRRYAVDDHGVKTAPFYVLRFTSMPSILAEIAFISNPDEEMLLRKPTFVKDVAQSLYKGITSFLAANNSDVR